MGKRLFLNAAKLWLSVAEQWLSSCKEQGAGSGNLLASHRGEFAAFGLRISRSRHISATMPSINLLFRANNHLFNLLFRADYHLSNLPENHRRGAVVKQW